MSQRNLLKLPIGRTVDAEINLGPRYEHGRLASQVWLTLSDVRPRVRRSAVLRYVVPNEPGQTALAARRQASTVREKKSPDWKELFTMLDPETQRRSRELRASSIARFRREGVLNESELEAKLDSWQTDIKWETFTSPFLLRLPFPEGNVYPAFQFNPDAEGLRQVVIAVNSLLRAADDPWGVSSWWLTNSGWLGKRPVDLLGTSDEQDLTELAAAHTEVSG